VKTRRAGLQVAEEPEAAELVVETDLLSVEDAVEAILAELAARGIVAG
jgi:adenylylsulfate kinase-like enzyme